MHPKLWGIWGTEGMYCIHDCYKFTSEKLLKQETHREGNYKLSINN